MDARFTSSLMFLCALPALLGAGYRSDNFVVEAPTPEIAKQVGLAAEHFRKELAMEWLGYELPTWSAPCPVKVKVGQIGAGGETRFSFYPKLNAPAEVAGWDMRIQGSLERILDSVLPHEISHAIFACHFRRPLPRWADEGAATLAEHESERRRQVLTLKQVLNTRRRITLKNLLNIKEYPKNYDDVMTLYAEGYTLAQLLVQEGGRARYLKFLADAHKQGWENAIHTHYGYQGIDELEKHWHGWVMAGCPEQSLPDGQMIADNSQPASLRGKDAASPAAKKNLVVRGQSPTRDHDSADRAFATEGESEERDNARLVASNAKPLPVSREQIPSAVAQSAGKNRSPTANAIRNAERDERDSEWVVDHRSVAATGSGDADDEERADLLRAQPRERPAQIKVAELRIPAQARQRTPWSEFPADPRPNPFAHSGARRNTEP
jgi:hypothetical protein